VLSRVLGTIRAHGLLAKSDFVLVALSGGPDSTALLHVLHKLAPRVGIRLAAAVVDHGLRRESAEEARMVCRRCRDLGVRCEVVRVDVAGRRRRHVSLQEAAREARLAALSALAARWGCHKVALGHTADDQAETVLFRILRGTGIEGLAGIPYRRECFIRPLLDVRRSEVLSFLRRRRLEFVSDPSNVDRHYARVRIRHDILPLLGRENPRVSEALLGLAREARERPRRNWRLDVPPEVYLSRRVVEVIDRLVTQGQGTRRVSVPGGDIVVSYGRASWRPRDADKGLVPGASPGGRSLRILGPGSYALERAAVVEITRFCTGAAPAGNAPCFDRARVGWPLRLRFSRPGDRMAPRGGRGRRKLSDLLINAKIPREGRATLPVLCDSAGTLLFVPGLRPSEEGRPDSATREWFEVRLTR
jgi:tRNA(Ile)-lysidine synthase